MERLNSTDGSVVDITSPPPNHQGLRIETPMAYFPEIESPDPSPADAPPQPTPYSLPPWTPDLAYPVLDSSIQDLPSPAGRPPDSLFRHRMPPPATVRKPLAEVPRSSTANVDLVETVLQLKDDLANSNVTLNMLRRENESLNLELQKGKITERQLREQCMNVESKLHGLQTEAAATKSQAKLEHLQKLHGVKTDYEKKLKEMEDSNRHDKLEMDRLQAIILEGALAKKRLEDANSNLEEYIAQVESEKKRLEGQLDVMNATVDSLRNMTTHHDDEVEAIQDNYEKDMQKALADANERETRLSEEMGILKKKIESLEADADSLQKEAATANAKVLALQATLDDKNKVLKESHVKYAQLRAERDTLEKDFNRVRRSAMKPRQSADLRAEIDRLKEALAEANTKCDGLLEERSALVKNMGREICQTVSADQSETEVPDRLGRIREAAERSQLLLEHRREIARLKAGHEEELKRLADAHDQDIKEVFEEAKAEVSSRARESRRRLKREYEAKIAAMERSHQVELAKIQRESDVNAAAVEEAMKQSSEEVAEMAKQLEKELSTKESLEASLRDLERKLVIEREKSKLCSKWKTSKKQWQNDTNKILRVMQQECNAVFAHNMHAVVNSPRRTDDSSSSLASSIASTVKHTPQNRWVKPSTSYTSPLDLSLALDDTEAYVRSVVEHDEE